MTLAYLASPYSHPDPAMREHRFREACRAAAQLMRLGIHVFSPIAHTHPIAEHGLPTGYQFWQAYDRLMLSRCDRLIVLMLDGWEESTGVADEIAEAQAAGKPVQYFVWTEKEEPQ